MGSSTGSIWTVSCDARHAKLKFLTATTRVSVPENIGKEDSSDRPLANWDRISMADRGAPTGEGRRSQWAWRELEAFRLGVTQLTWPFANEVEV